MGVAVGAQSNPDAVIKAIFVVDVTRTSDRIAAESEDRVIGRISSFAQGGLTKNRFCLKIAPQRRRADEA